MRTRDLLGDLRQDLRYAFRTLRRERGFTFFAVAIIALGIGASTTVFSVASALLLRPLPFAQPAQLVWIQNGDAPGLSAQTAQVNPYLSLLGEFVWWERSAPTGHSFVDRSVNFTLYAHF